MVNHEAIAMVEYAARKYGISIMSEAEAKVRQLLFVPGPQRSGISFDPPAVVEMGPLPADAADLLHEMAHIILGEPSTCHDTCESYVLMPFEWELAKYLARRMAPTSARPFLRQVRDYQGGTEIVSSGDYFELGEDVSCRRRRWWREGKRRAVEVGLLRPRTFTPTWKRLSEEESEALHEHGRSWEVPG